MLESLTAMELIYSMSPAQVRRLYHDSLYRENALTLSVATKVLAKRGDYGAMLEEINNMLEDAELKLGTDFATALANSLIELRNASPVLGRLGKDIAKATYTDDETFDWKNFKGKLTGEDYYVLNRKTYDEWLDGLTAHDIVAMKRDTWESIVKHLIDEQMRAGYARDISTRWTLEFLQKKFSKQIEEISKDKTNEEKMKSQVIRDLKIEFQK